MGSHLSLRLPCSETEVAYAAFAEAGTLAGRETDGRSLLRELSVRAQKGRR